MRPGRDVELEVDRVSQEQGYVKVHLHGQGPDSGLTSMNVMTSDGHLVKLLGQFGTGFIVTFRKTENGVQEFVE